MLGMVTSSMDIAAYLRRVLSSLHELPHARTHKA